MSGGSGQRTENEAGHMGLLCGAGALPLRVAEGLRRRGMRVTAIGIKGAAESAMEELAHEMHWTGLAKLGQWIRIFKAAGVDGVLMCGVVEKRHMFANKAAMLPDWKSIELWYRRLADRKDHAILGAVADEFEREGLPVRSILECCPELVAGPGCLSRRRPSARQWRDIRFGWPIAKQVAALQIGQCLVVKDRAVIATEGIDGTDAVLERGGRLAGPGAVAVKVARPGHDDRFDLPCVGPGTVQTLARAGLAALAIEAGRTLVLDRDEVKRGADAAGICIVAVEEGELSGER